jgi:hypothetical protein
MELYQSRMVEMHDEFGEYQRDHALADDARYLKGQGIDFMQELGYKDRKRIHNLKYYTWVEQQGKTYEEIMAQWYDPDYWTGIQTQQPEIDALIEEFNHKAGVQL